MQPDLGALIMKLFSPTVVRAEKRLLAGLALIVAIAVVVTIVLLTRSPNSNGQPVAASTSAGAATVERRNLVQTDTESGTLSYANAQTIYNRLSGTITWLPNVGRVIHPGQALFRIDNQPVILMNGSTPAFRDLSAADVQGPDILELNRNLIGLGFNPDGIVADDVWQAATTAAVEQFQASLGQSETGILSLGQVVFLPGAQLISTIDGTVGSTGGGGGSATTTGASYELSGSPHTEFVGLTTSTMQTTPSTTGKASSGHHHAHAHRSHRKKAKRSRSLAALMALLKAEIAELRSARAPSKPASSPSKPASSPSKPSSSSASTSPSSTGTSPSSSGTSGGGSATEILQSSSTRLVVTVDLPASSQSEAVRGEHVTVQMPNNTTVNGVISQVSPVAQASSSTNNNSSGGGGAGNGNGNGNASSTIPVTIRLRSHVTGAGLDQASVSVSFAQARANHVLSVPVTALVAVAGGGFAVQEATAPHKLIPVSTGLFAAGYVAISGSGIYTGLQVTDSQG